MNNWINSNLERFTFMDDDHGKITYNGIDKIFCKVCNKEIVDEDICMPFPSCAHVEGLAHKHCMDAVI